MIEDTIFVWKMHINENGMRLPDVIDKCIRSKDEMFPNDSIGQEIDAFGKISLTIENGENILKSSSNKDFP